MGLSCSLKLSTSTPRGYADRLSVVPLPNTLPSINPLIVLTATYFLLTLPGQVGRTTSSAVGGHGQTAVSKMTDTPGPDGKRKEWLELCPPSGGDTR
jgi:hypothetical protein